MSQDTLVLSLIHICIAGIQDIEALCAVEEEGVEGAILGRSIYEGTLDFQAAQARADELAK